MADWMAFNVADYVANTLHLTARQHGGYILLICAAWTGKGRLPASDEALRNIAKLTPKEWKEDGPILKAFLTEAEGVWIHERVQHEWNDAQSLIASKSKAGREGARKRWHGRANGSAIAQPSQTHRQIDAPIPLPVPSVPNGTGAAAPDRDVIFQEGLPWLMRRTGKTRGQAASLIGGWCKDFGEPAVRAALELAERENPVEPVSWIVATFKPKDARETWDQRRIREGMEALRQ